MKLPIIDRAGNYLAAMPPSVEGSGGHTAAFNAAVVLVRGFTLPHDQSLALLWEWNLSCLPPWSERELRDKIRSAHRDSRKPYGYLLSEDDAAVHRPASQPARSVSLPPSPPRPYTTQELAEKARKRDQWPLLRALTKMEMGAIAHARSCPLAAVEILSQNGLLMTDDTRPGCYALTQGTFRQYRRIDGEMMPCGQKSQNAAGSQAKGFYGAVRQFRNLEPDDFVFVVEGAIGLLESIAIQWLCSPQARRWKALAAHSCASRFFYEPDLLKNIARHHCRILPDPGPAGKDAARAWRDELRAVGCTVDFAQMPEGFQDLRVLLSAGSDGVPAMRSILAYPTASRMGGAA